MTILGPESQFILFTWEENPWLGISARKLLSSSFNIWKLKNVFSLSFFVVGTWNMQIILKTFKYIIWKYKSLHFQVRDRGPPERQICYFKCILAHSAVGQNTRKANPCTKALASRWSMISSFLSFPCSTITTNTQSFLPNTRYSRYS